MTEEEFQLWRASPTTQEIVALLKKRRDGMQATLMGLLASAGSTEVVVPAVRLGAAIAILEELIDIRHSDLQMKEVGR